MTNAIDLRIIQADDGGYMVQGGGLSLTPQSTAALLEAIRTIVLNAFEPGQKNSSEKNDFKKPMDN